MAKKMKGFVNVCLSVFMVIVCLNLSSLQIIAADQDNPNTTSERAQNDVLVTTKNSTLNADGTVDIDLKAYVTGSVVAHTEPIDIVLVLDQSGSMGQQIRGKQYEFINYEAPLFMSGLNIMFAKVKGVYREVFYDKTAKEWFYKKGTNSTPIYIKQKYGNLTEGYEFYRGDNREIARREALKQAVNTFVTSLSEDAIAGNINHRISIVGFGDGQAKGYTSTEILSLTGGKKNYSNLDRGDYAASFQDANTESGYNTLMNSVNMVSSISGVLTNTNYGLEMANAILQDGSQNDRQKAIIVFTDGAPNDANSDGSINYEIANKSLESSYTMKNNKASVYSVGMIDGADPNLPIKTDPIGDVTGQINKFMQLLSSNYKDAGSTGMDRNMDSDASNPQNNGFYLTAKSSDELNEIFGKIYEEISPSIILNEKAKLIDTISDYFTVTNDTIVDAKTSEYLGKDNAGNMLWDTPVKAEGTKVTITGNKIEVSGFDYSALSNVVFTRPDKTGEGYKLIVTLKNVKQLEGFIGGDQVPTNKTDSGIYDANGTPVEHFEVPTVNVPLNFDFKTNNTSIYAGNKWKKVIEFLENESGNMYYLQDGKEYEFGNKRNDYVDVVYTIKHYDNIVGTYKVASGGNTLTMVNGFNLETKWLGTDVEEFHITAEVVSKNDTNHKFSTDAKESYLYIFKPSVDVSDNTIFLGETSRLVDRVSKEITWASGYSSYVPKPKGDIPSLTVTAYEVNANGTEHIDFTKEEALKETTQYTLMLKNEEVDITGLTKIKNNTFGNDSSGADDFTVYVLKGQLDITKTIDQQYTTENKVNANQSFVYKIEQFDEAGKLVKTFYQTINFSANALQTSKTVSITGLEKGKYTVSEVSDWSWKYDTGTSSSNCISNNHTLQEIFIGDADANNTSGKPYYGSEDGSSIRNEDVSNKAIVELDANRKIADAIGSLLGDVALAANQFTK